MEDFIIGVNYWASHAGTDMWSDWSEDVVAKDLSFLKENGVTTIRVFPLWSDFQPVKPVYSGGMSVYEYRMENDKLPQNKYFLDETMMSRFDKFLQICRKNGISVVVALLTGFMSGRLFVPSALFGKNLYSDSTALLFEQKFIKGFVSRFANNDAIVGWDIGNECNCMMGVESKAAAFSWLFAVTNAIKAEDCTRPIISGMDHLTLEGKWTVQDQAECVDIFTTHPYPYWVKFGSLNKITDMKTMLLPTAMNKFHSDIGEKPSMVEEVGTMGPMICNDAVSADFAKVNLFSTWANGADGMMWWCAFDQTHLNHAPYVWKKCETELGMASSGYETKPVLQSFKYFSDFIKSFNSVLPPAKPDGTILLTRGQEHWGIGWMAYVLGKMSGANLNFAYAEHNIPDSDVYLLPSLTGNELMSKNNLDLLMNRVYNGAILYISNDDGIISEFTKYTGLSVNDSSKTSEKGIFEFNGKEIPFACSYKYSIESKGAEILAYENKSPIFTRYKYGAGQVYYLNYPLEKNMLYNMESAEKNEIFLYKTIFESSQHILSVNKSFLCVTEHITEDGILAIIINYSSNKQRLDYTLKENYYIDKCLSGRADIIKPYDCVVLEIKAKTEKNGEKHDI